jgi:hypothetical protein
MAKWIYHNENPDGNHSDDCVTRAISTALGLKYSQTRRKLHHTAKLFTCDKLTRDCYSNLLDRVFGLPRVECNGLSVGQFADLHPHGTYIVRVPNHATVIIDGNCYDTFYCLDYKCDICWRVD